jgi:hypothetical protein
VNLRLGVRVGAVAGAFLLYLVHLALAAAAMAARPAALIVRFLGARVTLDGVETSPPSS